MRRLRQGAHSIRQTTSFRSRSKNGSVRSERIQCSYEKLRRTTMSGSRRNFFRNAAVFGTGLLGWSESLRAQMRGMTHGGESERPKRGSKKSPVAAVRMITPDVDDLPHEMDGNTKVFRLVAEPVKRRVVPWKTLEVWGYNGSCPGPTIQVTQ